MRPRVAFIDDEPEMRTVVLDLLVDSGFDVLVVERESASAERIAEWDPKVVAIDPEGAGSATRPPFTLAFELARHPKLRHTALVLVARPRTLSQHETDVIALRPAETVPKPFSSGELVETMRRLTAPRPGL